MFTHCWYHYHCYIMVILYMRILWATRHVYTDVLYRCWILSFTESTLIQQLDNPGYLYNVTVLIVSTSYSLYDITLMIWHKIFATMNVGLERDFTVTIMSITYNRVGNLVTFNVMTGSLLFSFHVIIWSCMTSYYHRKLLSLYFTVASDFIMCDYCTEDS